MFHLFGEILIRVLATVTGLYLLWNAFEAGRAGVRERDPDYQLAPFCAATIAFAGGVFFVAVACFGLEAVVGPLNDHTPTHVEQYSHDIENQGSR
ncbi:MAG: hypothetical protein U0136_13505 [Bdellovibrionota bacterium]